MRAIRLRAQPQIQPADCTGSLRDRKCRGRVIRGWSHRILIVTAALFGLACLAVPSGDSNDASSRRNGKIAFLHGGIAIVNPDGSGLRHPPGASGGFAPDWSPDGQHLLYVRSDVADWFAGRNNIWVMRANGRERRSLLPRAFDRKAGPVLSSAEWAPDGKRIAFSATATQQKRTGIYVMNADGSGIRRLWSQPGQGSLLGPAVNSISWSPNGRQLAFNLGVHYPRLFVLDVRTRRARLVYKSPVGHPDGQLPGIDWSPDGRNLVFTGLERVAFTLPPPHGGTRYIEEPGVMVVPASGGEPKVIAAGAYTGYFDTPEGWIADKTTQAFAPAFSPDGREIVFISLTALCYYFGPKVGSCDNDAALVRVRRDGTGRQKIHDFGPTAMTRGSHVLADSQQPSWQALPR